MHLVVWVTVGAWKHPCSRAVESVVDSRSDAVVNLGKMAHSDRNFSRAFSLLEVCGESFHPW